MDWSAIIRAVCPRAKAAVVSGLAEAMPQIIEEFKINTPLRQAHFLAQCAHESDSFQTTVEYASGDAYDTRTDLGNTKAKDGDGRLYKGYGLIQTTGKTNQQAAATRMGILAAWKKNPKILATFPYAALSAAIFWESRKLNALADHGADDATVKAITKKVNGGTNGLHDRQEFFHRAIKVLDGGKVNAKAEVLPRAKIKALQEQLIKLGYVEVGNPDGQIGGKTAGAITTFQFDNNLPTTGKFDAETMEHLYVAEPREINETRSTGKPKDSRILSDAGTLKTGSVGVGVLAGAKPAWEMVKETAGDPLQALEGVNSHLSYVNHLLEPLQALGGFAMDNWMILAVAGALGVWALAKRIENARISDHQTGKTA